MGYHDICEEHINAFTFGQQSSGCQEASLLGKTLAGNENEKKKFRRKTFISIAGWAKLVSPHLWPLQHTHHFVDVMNAYQRHWQIVLPWTFLLLTSPVLGANSTPQGFSSTSVLRQNNFFEWLLSIFQTIPPFSVIPTTGRPPTTAPVTTEPSACAACKCGAANSIRRIVGGYETQVNQYPWMAMLLFRGHFYCGASLISDRYVVTAAHCLRSFPRPFVSVRLMAHNLKDRTVRVIDRRADKVVVHPKYSMSNNDNDIGLVKLDQVVEMSSVMRPVCLAMSERSYDDELAVITGWGVTTEGGQVSQTLRVSCGSTFVPNNCIEL